MRTPAAGGSPACCFSGRDAGSSATSQGAVGGGGAGWGPVGGGWGGGERRVREARRARGARSSPPGGRSVGGEGRCGRRCPAPGGAKCRGGRSRAEPAACPTRH